MTKYSKTLLQKIADINNITTEQAEFILKQSSLIMPLLTLQYGDDIDMITKSIKDYQRTILNDIKK